MTSFFLSSYIFVYIEKILLAYFALYKYYSFANLRIKVSKKN